MFYNSSKRFVMLHRVVWVLMPLNLLSVITAQVTMPFCNAHKIRRKKHI